MARKSTPKGVVDTSVLIAGMAGFKSQIETPAKAVMGRLGVRRHLIGNIVNLLREEAEFVDGPTTVEISPDPADDPFCACAEIGNAAFIVTLNPKDFPQRKLRATVIAPGAALPTTAPRQPRTRRRSS